MLGGAESGLVLGTLELALEGFLCARYFTLEPGRQVGHFFHMASGFTTMLCGIENRKVTSRTVGP